MQTATRIIPESKREKRRKNGNGPVSDAAAKSSYYFTEEVKPIQVKKKALSRLLEEMANTGYQGRRLAEVVRVWEAMLKDKNATIVMGYTGALSVAGQYKIINWLVKNRFIDVLVPTGANISEDIIDAMGRPYWKGTHTADDVKLLGEDLNRYYDVYGKESDYMVMTEMIADFYVGNLESDRPYSSREILYLFGRWLWKKGIRSIVAVAAKHKVPVFCPAIVDSPYGDAGLIAKSKGFNLVIDNMKDYVEFAGLSGRIKDTGVIYIGGGVPKDFIQLLAVCSDLLYPGRKIPDREAKIYKGQGANGEELRESYYPHKYAIQITTDSPQWGGLSGCTFEEATSWGKEDVNALKSQCFCDATIGLPIVVHALNEKFRGKRRAPDYSFLFENGRSGSRKNGKKE
ncbi:MAG: deoxyhypusine synthase family protein [Candidatus Blackburnbacteria bacterium]|nr:deoxyhypusine synthase family protein [Candidatus Blackburnbacteria bacterium]